MSDERDSDRDPETGGFDADEWFRTQFGGQPPASTPPSPPVSPEPPVEPAPPTEPAPPSPEPAPPAYPPLAAPLASAPPPASVPVDPPPPAEFDPPTELVSVEPTVAIPAIDQVGRPAGDAATELMRTPEEGGALDELFSTEKFQEFDEGLIPVVPRAAKRGAGAQGGEPPVRPPLTKNQKVLLWLAGSLAALLVLVALFFVGTRIPDLLGPAPGAEPSPTPTPTPTPTETARPVGPVPPGDYWWDELWGGECLEPFGNAWQDEFTVVDCSVPHTAQLVARLPFPLPEGLTEQGPYPGEEALAAQITILCSAPGVIDLAAAGAFRDAQLQGSFAATEEQWDDGEYDYFCFVSRSSGELLTGSLAVPPAPPAE